MWKYYWSLVREIPGLWKSAKAKWAMVISASPLLVYLSPWMPPAWVSSVTAYWQRLPHWLPLVPLIMLVLYGLLKLNYNRHAVLQSSVRQKEEEIAKLRAREFEIIFGSGGSFEQEDQWGSRIRRLYRIGVVNNSAGPTIENVKVQLETTRGFHVSFLPVGLHQMNDRSRPPLLSFALNPRETKYIDVVSKVEGAAGIEGEICLCYAISGVGNSVSPGKYKLDLLVTGHSAEAKRRTFNVGVGEHDRLIFWPEDGVLFNAQEEDIHRKEN